MASLVLILPRRDIRSAFSFTHVRLRDILYCENEADCSLASAYVPVNVTVAHCSLVFRISFSSCDDSEGVSLSQREDGANVQMPFSFHIRAAFPRHPA